MDESRLTESEIFLKKKPRQTQPTEETRPERQPEQQEKPPPAQKPEAALLLWNLPQANPFQSFSPRRVRGENTMTQPPWAAFTSDVASLVVGEVEGGPGVKFCVSDFRQSQEWHWKAGRILA